MGIFNDKAARRAREERANAPVKHEGKFLSWGGSGRSSTRPENQGLSKREIDALDAENAKSGRYGMHGAKYISSNAREAQRRGRGK